MMRVIAGSARRILLETPKGFDTRPTTDRIKETLFNIIQPYIEDTAFLDLFAGCGGIGIEALSRGAAYCAFVENGRSAIECIKNNLQRTKLFRNAKVYESDIFSSLKKIQASGNKFDIIFIDPPYEGGYYEKTLEVIKSSNITNPDALIIVEALIDTDFSFAESMGFKITREKEYKSNKHVFLKLD